jgi:ribosomal protein L7/L12
MGSVATSPGPAHHCRLRPESSKLMSNSQQDLPSDVVAALKSGSKIEAIKRLRERFGLDLKEAKERVDAYLAQTPENSTSEARRVPADRLQSKEQWLASQRLPTSVIEELARGHKIEAIKLLRASHGLGLKEAKDWVDAYQQGRSGRPVAEPRGSGSAASGFWWLLALLAAVLLAYALLGQGGPESGL